MLILHCNVARTKIGLTFNNDRGLSVGLLPGYPDHAVVIIMRFGLESENVRNVPLITPLKYKCHMVPTRT